MKQLEEIELIYDEPVEVPVSQLAPEGKTQPQLQWVIFTHRDSN